MLQVLRIDNKMDNIEFKEFLFLKKHLPIEDYQAKNHHVSTRKLFLAQSI